MTSKGFKHSNTGSAAKSANELPYFCRLSKERADAEAKEIVSQSAYGGEKSAIKEMVQRSECSTLWAHTEDFGKCEGRPSQADAEIKERMSQNSELFHSFADDGNEARVPQQVLVGDPDVCARLLRNGPHPSTRQPVSYLALTRTLRKAC